MQIPAAPTGIPPKLFRQANLIGGKWIDPQDGAAIEVRNPASGELVGLIPTASPAQVDQAITSAAQAFNSWKKTLAKDRAAILRRLHALMLENREPLARLMTIEQGKPLAEARGEVLYAAGYVEWFAEEARRTYGEIIPANRADTRLLVVKEPVGVAATITPWNFPSAMLARKIAPALAAGCTVVSKPAELTPFSALALAALAEEAGLPPGVWNIVTGVPQQVGSGLCASPLVRKLSFTGSTQTGKLLMAQCTPTLKRLSMELGGNAPFIVFESADIPAAVKGAIASKYRNAGQTCVCVNRFIVHDSIYDRFAAALAEAAQKLKVGNGLEDKTEVGPLINEAAVAKVERHIADAAEKGAKVVCGGSRHSLGLTFFQPTVIADAKPGMQIAQEETFGPIAALFRFKTEDEAVALANDTPYGLAAYFYSRDLGQIWRVAEQIEAGMIGINEGLISSEVIPFGGVKESGFGREGGSQGIEDYMQTKYLCMGGI